MLRYIWWAIKIAVALVLAAVLHYTLPQRDVVYITGSYNRVIQFGANSIFWSSPDSGTSVSAGEVSRDVLFIESVQRSGDVMVYRNEDTGFWPPYLKFDSSNLQARASDLVSNRSDPQWVVLRQYGWRIPFLTAYPNAISVRPTDDPDALLIPWFNIAFLLVLFAIWWAIRVRWKRFRRARVEPAVLNAEAAYVERRAATGRWFRSWRR